MMNESVTTPSVVTPDDRTLTFTHHARTMVLHHGEKILSEIPKTMRRVALLLLVLSISIPAFLVGLLVVLWRLG
jgi:hypothetical protein